MRHPNMLFKNITVMHIIFTFSWYKLGVYIIFKCHFLLLGYHFLSGLYLSNVCILFFTMFLVLSIKYFQCNFALQFVNYACVTDL